MTHMLFCSSIVNLSTILDVLNLFSQQNNYGANTTVTYHTPFFWGVSTVVSKVPVIQKMNPDDYILITITIPDLQNFNLFNITPYFFEYNKENVFASTDETIPFFTNIQKGTVHKICITSSLQIADEFSKKNYIISRLPVDMLSRSSFTLLFRLGITEKSLISTETISNFVSCIYYKSFCPVNTQGYYTSSIIKNSRTPISSSIVCDLTEFDRRKLYYEYRGFTQHKSFPYLSNFYKINYAMKHVYDAIRVKPYAKLHADNSLESYYNSDPINLTDIQYIYIVALNHNKLGVALTSNIQIYDFSNLKSLQTFLTSPDLPSFTHKNYPFVSKNDLPEIQVIKLNIKKHYNDITKLLIVERICYNPISFQRPSYNYKGNFAIFVR